MLKDKYLYHCTGCQKDDTEYPDKEVVCEECQGEDCGAYVDENGDCWKCEGYGAYTRRIKVTYHRWARSDAYGIYTGLFCDKCYNNNYPYKKDRYFDESYCGERLEEDY